MTASQMRQEAELIFESIASGDTCGFEDVEWSVLLTKAQYEVVSDILEEGLTRNAFNRRALDAIIKLETVETADIADNSAEFPNSYLVTIDDKAWWVLSETWVGDKDTRIDSITFDEYSVNKDNPFRKPDVDEAFWSLPMNSKIMVITDGATYATRKYRFEYAENPMENPIIPNVVATDTNCILHDSIHPKIVERAARLAKAYVKDSEGFQLQYIEDNKTNV